MWLNGELETRRLAEETGVAKSTLSSILNTLEARKLVRRRAHEQERRLVLVDLTAAGAELIRTLSLNVKAEEARIVARLSGSQIKATRDAVLVILSTIAQLEVLEERNSSPLFRRRSEGLPKQPKGNYEWCGRP